MEKRISIEDRTRELEELIACCYVDPEDVDVEAIVRNVAEELKKRGLYPKAI